ncbi:hypothetical protein HanIR_Chr08g0347721 [Helianthus annuus]|nr:hypothetical protein HanIR_Chr08g0347721 [Helianthus annuus]
MTETRQLCLYPPYLYMYLFLLLFRRRLTMMDFVRVWLGLGLGFRNGVRRSVGCEDSCVRRMDGFMVWSWWWYTPAVEL